MALYAGSGSKFESELSASFSKLCRDPSLNVRKTMAHGFHEVRELSFLIDTAVALYPILLLQDLCWLEVCCCIICAAFNSHVEHFDLVCFAEAMV